jgi:uncharacterized protein
MKFLRLLFRLACFTLLGSLLLVVGCQSKLIYFPRPYSNEALAKLQPPQDTTLTWQTDEGSQQGFLCKRVPEPQRLWIVCAGNGSLALDLRSWLQKNTPATDACFFFDYPGYGKCTGSPTPGRIRESLRQGVPQALQELGWSLERDRHRLAVFGHSLGSANALQAADLFHIQRGVLLSPFTTMMDMAQHVLRVPLGPLVVHRFDNRRSLANLQEHTPEASFAVFHGTEDEVIPIGQSRTLVSEFPRSYRLTEVPGGRHNNLLDSAGPAIAAALR